LLPVTGQQEPVCKEQMGSDVQYLTTFIFWFHYILFLKIPKCWSPSIEMKTGQSKIFHRSNIIQGNVQCKVGNHKFVKCFRKESIGYFQRNYNISLLTFFSSIPHLFLSIPVRQTVEKISAISDQIKTFVYIKKKKTLYWGLVDFNEHKIHRLYHN
jgi:hypothetical protein